MMKSYIKYIILVLATVVLAAIDQLTKYIVVQKIPLGTGVPVIKDVFEIFYIRNTGSAWGMLSQHTTLLIIVSLIEFALIIYIFHNVSGDKKYLPICVLCTFILGGAVGNLIDRIRLGYVVDFLYFKLIDFPVFNVADIYVTVSVIVLIILMFTKYRSNEDIEFILGERKNKNNE